MKDFLLNAMRAAAVMVAALFAMLPSDGALAQTVVQLPTSINANSTADFGNGPMELKVLLGNAWMFTSQGSGVSTAVSASTTMVLTATPTTPPCVGCEISGAGITSGTTVAAYNGTTTITLSAAMTVAASTPVAWGAACPTFASLAGLPPSPNIQVQPSANDLPMYTQARVCGLAQNGPGATVLVFPIGAH